MLPLSHLKGKGARRTSFTCWWNYYGNRGQTIHQNWSTSSTSLKCQEKLKQLRILQSINLVQKPLLSLWTRDPLLKSFLQGLMKALNGEKKRRKGKEIIPFPWLPLIPGKHKVLSGAGQRYHFPPVPHQFMKLLMRESETTTQEQLEQHRAAEAKGRFFLKCMNNLCLWWWVI